jgi:hypothetical protein
MIKHPRYRIVQKPSYTDPGLPIFEVQKKIGFWWEHAGLCVSLADAEQRVIQLKAAETTPVKTKTVKVFY